MSIINVTNLTNNPKEWISNKYKNAFEELERESNMSISESEKYDFIDNQIGMLEEQAEETLGKDLLGLIDNYLVNFDYFSEVKEWYQNKLKN